jgi:hypothetical protein
VADYVFDNAPPPPELRRAFDYKAWGINLLQLPAGEIRTINRAMNAYSTLRDYRKAQARGKASEWTEQNPDDWQFVSAIIADRMTRAKERKQNV